MPKGLKRYYGQGHLHFVTFSCYQRLPFLGTEHPRDVFVHELAKVRMEFHFRLFGYVVMPNHVHLLLNEPPQGTPSTVLQLLKQRVSRRLRNSQKANSDTQSQFSLSTPTVEAPSFWQPRFYDFNVYSRGKASEKLNYMHANPVIRKLVGHPSDWPWSSWSFYFKHEQGLIAIDPLDL